MHTVKITCAILCYNYGRFLENAIQSCLSQTIDPSLYEILVIDDGSTDDTPKVCEKFAGLIRVSRTANLGFSQSLYRGIQEARGEYVAYLDADDWWHQDKLAFTLEGINKNALYIIHPLNIVGENGESFNEVGASGNTSSVCVHREAALTLLPATSEIYCRPLLDLGKGLELSQPLGFYRIHGKAMTDRSAQTAHTAFFATTNHLTADRLAFLSKKPPFWEVSAEKLNLLSLKYRAEATTKDFERFTEQRFFNNYLKAWFVMMGSWLKAKQLPSKFSWRLTGRALAQLAKLK